MSTSPFARQATTAREPHFLSESRHRNTPANVVFRNVEGPWGGGALPNPPEPPPEPTPPPVVEVAPPPPPPPAPVPQGPGPEEFAERISAAVSALRLTSERLAEAARSDALELALLVARKIVDSELATNVEPLFSVIRSVVRKAGESRKIVVRLAPADAARVEAAGQSRALSGVNSAEISVVADPSLGTGDCVVDADFGTVDGRLELRFEELRRLLRDAATEER